MPIRIEDLPQSEGCTPEELTHLQGGIAVPYYLCIPAARASSPFESWGGQVIEPDSL